MVPLDLSLSGKKDESIREEEPSGKKLRREQDPKGERVSGRLRTGDNGASTRASQQPGGTVVNQATRKADGGIRETTPLDLSHGGKYGAPSREARRKGEPPRKHPQGVPVPSKVMIDEEGGNKADAGSKGEEGHHPPRAVTSRRGRPVRGCTPHDRRKQIHREEGP